MVRVKICGITNLQDARLATRLGADALGFNFYEKSVRFVTPVAAGDIVKQLVEPVDKVGVFVNHTIDEILNTIDVASLDAVQLHGDESPEFVGALRTRCSCRIIKAIRVASNFDHSDSLEFKADGILLDGYSANARGGTGETFDWDVAKIVSTLVPELWLAGGLTPENVRLAITEVRPYAVDVCSSLESVPGVKDAAKLERFISEAKSA
ncbi:MAG: phosphoribosylanthranilate isomerase [Acidobacteria bacterium]|nr:MAG: phosphoribosylanthranilate isomerase [Acidobacteriota bacterium]